VRRGSHLGRRKCPGTGGDGARRGGAAAQLWRASLGVSVRRNDNKRLGKPPHFLARLLGSSSTAAVTRVRVLAAAQVDWGGG
jgi:hypothetical protein